MYRPDIDGLRAVAVMCVIFYHVGITAFSGGYIGVDVFFVISGFLIIRLLHKEISEGTFSFGRFYIRRVRRLFPAFFVTLCLVMLLSVYLFSPAHLARLGHSLIYTVLSLSNIFFWQEAGYFDESINVKPLLHTWSLSVEEQFYLIFPTLLILLTRLRQDKIIFFSLVLIGIISLFFAEFFVEADQQSTSFYLTPFRMVEFIIGGLIVWLVRYQPNNDKLLELLAFMGVFLILYSAMVFTKDTPFPGVNALLPCLGAAILIYTGGATLTGRILSSRVMVGVGLISYSLYLVHWPIIVFYQYWNPEPLGGFDKYGIIIFSVILAALFYFFIEKPFRYPRQERYLSPTAFGLVVISLIVVLIVPSSHMWAEKGWGWRFNNLIADLPSEKDMWSARNEPARVNQCFIFKEQPFAKFDKSVCMNIILDQPNFLIVGDSFAADTYLVMSEAFPEVNFLQANVGNCRPFLNNPVSKTCQLMVDYIFNDFLPNSALDGVVLSGAWEPPDLVALDSTVDYLHEMGLKVVVVGSTVRYIKSVSAHIVDSGRSDIDGVTRYTSAFLRENTRILNTYMKRKYTGYVTFVDYYGMMCDETCRIFTDQNKLIYIDWGHLSLDGGKYYAQLVRDQYGKLFPSVWAEKNPSNARSKARMENKRLLKDHNIFQLPYSKGIAGGQCNIEYINAQLMTTSEYKLTRNTALHLKGWAMDIENSRLPDSIVIRFEGEANKSFFGIAKPGLPRPDVKKYLSLSGGVDNSGFETNFNLIDLPEGKYLLNVLMKFGDDVYTCDNGRNILVH